MDTFSSDREMMAEESDDFISVVDVYDQAASIGKEFEKMIETFGVESLTGLMPKVIKALENLETLAARYEQENTEISNLKLTIEKLESEKNDKAQERMRYEEELEQIEDNWHRETKELYNSVNKLKIDNRRLKEHLQNQQTAVKEEVAAVTRKTEEKEIEVLTKLKETVDKQRDEVRKQKRELSQKNVDCEALQTQLEQIVKLNTELRKKNHTQKKQARTLLEEKSDLEAQLVDKEQQINHIQDIMRDQESQEDDKSVTPTQEKPNPLTEVEVDDEPHQRNLHEDIIEHSAENFIPHEPTDENLEKLQEKLSMVGKIVIDLKDPNRPRYTISELRTVLMERNELKTKLIAVEEELADFKPKPVNQSMNSIVSDDDSADDATSNSYCGEDLPVYGPINKEPYEKLYPGRRRESGIRKFFRSLFGSSPTSTPPPQRRRHSRRH